MTIEVKNDEMLGRTNENTLHIELIKLQQENQELKEINEEHKKLNGELREENKKYKEVIEKVIELLGNYRHYSMPDEKQNSDNEDLVNNAFDILKEAE